MTFRLSLGSFPIALLVTSFTALAQEGGYREIFPAGDTGPNVALTSANWKANSGATATDQTTTGAIEIANEIGRGGGLAGLNAGIQANLKTARGYLLNADDALNGHNQLYWTDEFTIETSKVDSFQWYLGNGSATDVFRLAIAITDSSAVTTWYASSETFSSAAKSAPVFPSLAELKSLAFVGAKFNTLAFTPGSLLALGETVSALPEGMITAFGLYSDLKTGAHRIDTFTITPVPEPTAALLGITGMMLLCGRRKRVSRQA